MFTLRKPFCEIQLQALNLQMKIPDASLASQTVKSLKQYKVICTCSQLYNINTGNVCMYEQCQGNNPCSMLTKTLPLIARATRTVPVFPWTVGAFFGSIVIGDWIQAIQGCAVWC